MVGAGVAPGLLASSRVGFSFRAAVIARQRLDDTGDGDDEDDDSRDDDDLIEQVTAERGIAEAQFLAANRAWVDYWLMQRFPGRTLEELDSVDWPRLMQAVDVEHIVAIETKRKQFTSGRVKRKDVTNYELRQFDRHDRLLELHGYDAWGEVYEDEAPEGLA
jgi:hypothetical protein